MRQRADWMSAVDERLIELSRSDTGITGTRAAELGVATRNHLYERLNILCDYGLLQRVGYGQYRISEQGCAFLNEELDASTLEPAEE